MQLCLMQRMVLWHACSVWCISSTERSRAFLDACTGRELGALSVHPRLGALLLAARDMDAPELGCLVASLLTERDIFRGPASSADLALRVYAVQEGERAQSCCMMRLPPCAYHAACLLLP